jgi:hypothetical protein
MRSWKGSVDAEVSIVEARTEKRVFSPCAFLLRCSPETVSCSVKPSVLFAPCYNSISGDLSRVGGVSHGHSDGYMPFSWGLDIAVQSVETLKRMRSDKVVANTFSVDVCGSTFPPDTPLPPSTAIEPEVLPVKVPLFA